jgi:hypothetical protein
VIVGIAYSRPRAVLAASAMAATVGLAWLHHHLADHSRQEIRQVTGLRRELEAQIAALGGCGDGDLKILREEVARFRVRLGGQETWASVVACFGPRWAAETDRLVEKEGYSAVIGIFSLRAPTTADWPKILQAIGAAERLPGVGIVGFQMKTGRGLGPRPVQVVKVEVAIQTQAPASLSVNP